MSPKDENHGVVGEVVLASEAGLKTDDVGCVDIDWFDNVISQSSVSFTVAADLSLTPVSVVVKGIA